MKTCKICGCSFDEENFEGVVVNEGIDNEYHVCCDCVPSECNNGHIISCEACGSYFSADKLHDEEIEGHSFTACPACGKDVVEGLSRAEFEDEYFRPRYSVVVRQFSGSVRGYIVSANGRHEVMKRLLEKLDFNYVAEVSIGEILVKEDEFNVHEQKKFDEIKAKHSTTIVVDADVGEALAFVQDLLEAEADAIKNREPHATASIGRLNEAAYEVFSISNEIDAEEFDDGK